MRTESGAPRSLVLDMKGNYTMKKMLLASVSLAAIAPLAAMAAGGNPTFTGTPGSIVTDTITTTGIYQLNAAGAQGGADGSGGGAGGLGASLSGYITLSSGTNLLIATGTQGALATFTGQAAAAAVAASFTPRL